VTSSICRQKTSPLALHCGQKPANLCREPEGREREATKRQGLGHGEDLGGSWLRLAWRGHDAGG